MVLKDKKILFLHIPKTAGQSITRFLMENENEPYSLKNSKFGLIYNNKSKLKGPKHYHHLHLQEYQTLNIVDNLQDYFKFTVFRNPYSRFISAFKFNQSQHNYDSYKDFIKYFSNKKFSKKEVMFRHFIPQTWYIDYNIDNIDQYFFQERLNELETFFFKKFNFTKKIGHENISKKQTKDLDNYTKDFIKDFYKKDFKILGYKYETP